MSALRMLVWTDDDGERTYYGGTIDQVLDLELSWPSKAWTHEPDCPEVMMDVELCITRETAREGYRRDAAERKKPKPRALTRAVVPRELTRAEKAARAKAGASE